MGTSCFACTNSCARLLRSLILRATVVGVGALIGELTFVGEAGLWLLVPPILKYAGVTGNGEKWSTIEDEDLSARYGKFQNKNLFVRSVFYIDEKSNVSLRIVIEMIPSIFLCFVLSCSDMPSKSLLVDFAVIVKDIRQ